MKLVREIKEQTVEHLLIASYVVGWEAGRLGYMLKHPHVQNHWDNLKKLIHKESK